MAGRPVTLITGASAGLGAEFARQCAVRGEKLVLLARRRDRLEALKAELGSDVTLFAADLSLPGAPTDQPLPGAAAWGGYPGGLAVTKGAPLFPRLSVPAG